MEAAPPVALEQSLTLAAAGGGALDITVAMKAIALR
jgi:hypothetical protein